MKKFRVRTAWIPVFFLLASALPALAGFPNADDDMGLNVIQSENVQFPLGVQLQGIHSGKVHLVVSVDAEGHLVDHLVVAYTHQAFVKPAVEAIKAWSYEPARVHGRPRASRADLIFAFKSDLIVTVQNADFDISHSIFGERYAFEPCSLRDLDHIPVPIHVVSPSIPDGVLASGEQRVVKVEFYIDQEGNVRVPSVSREQVDDLLAAAAVESVEKWHFEPPMRKGNAVLVLAQQDFRFVAKTK